MYIDAPSPPKLTKKIIRKMKGKNEEERKEKKNELFSGFMLRRRKSRKMLEK